MFRLINFFFLSTFGDYKPRTNALRSGLYDYVCFANIG